MVSAALPAPAVAIGQLLLNAHRSTLTGAASATAGSTTAGWAGAAARRTRILHTTQCDSLWALLEDVLTLGWWGDRKTVAPERVCALADFAAATMINGISTQR